MLRIAAILSVFSLVACEANDEAGACWPDQASAIAGSMSARVVTISDDARVVRVEGSARHSLGRAIRTVEVEGRLATPGEGAFNFSSWSVDLPLSFVAGLEETAAGHVTLTAVARDSCGKTEEFSAVALGRPSLGDVRTLSVELEGPAGESYVPTTRAAPATVRVVANGEAEGAEATVSTSAGVLSGGLDEAGATNRVVLARGSDGASRGLLALVSTTPGTLVVTVRAGERVATGTLLAAGPPSFTPSSATLQAGTVLDVVARSPGRIVSCSVEVGGGVTVTQDGTPRDGAFDPGTVAGESVAFEVTVPSDDSQPFSAGIRCEDAFGQAAAFGAD